MKQFVWECHGSLEPTDEHKYRRNIVLNIVCTKLEAALGYCVYTYPSATWHQIIKRSGEVVIL